jgi:hypothetical protein
MDDIMTILQQFTPDREIGERIADGLRPDRVDRVGKLYAS